MACGSTPRSLNFWIQFRQPASPQVWSRLRNQALKNTAWQIADNFIKYLLLAAIVENEHLKSFDLLCLDPDGSTHKRYDEFVAFPKNRFQSGDFLTFLERYSRDCLKVTTASDAWPPDAIMPTLESTSSTGKEARPGALNTFPGGQDNLFADAHRKFFLVESLSVPDHSKHVCSGA